MRDEAYLRAEIRWLVERARIALELPPSAVVGCSDEQIAEILEAQAIPGMPPALDEFMRVAGVMEGGSLLRELQGWTGVGFRTMLDAKDNARKTAAFTRSSETFGPDRVVFLSDPGGTVLWLETEKPDSPVWALTEDSRSPVLGYTRLADWLEYELLLVEKGVESGEFSRRGPLSGRRSRRSTSGRHRPSAA
jgi:hypothetical protein